MKLINRHKSLRAALAGVLILGATVGVQARKGYLPRLFKRSRTANTEPAAEAPAPIPMGRVVIPLNRLTAGDVQQMLDDAYGRDNEFSVVEPSRLAKGVVVIGPKSEIDGIRELLAQADPNDRDYLTANLTAIPEGVVSEEELEADLPDGFYAEARKNAEEQLEGKDATESTWQQKANPKNWFGKNKPVTRQSTWRQRINPLNWFDGKSSRKKTNTRQALPSRQTHGQRLMTPAKPRNTERKPISAGRENTAIKLTNANANELATQMQALYSDTDVKIVPVEKVNVVLVTGSKSEIRDIHRSITQLDQAAAESSTDELADATQYIRKMANTRNTAFRITRPYKPRIRPLPPISISGDPEPDFNKATAVNTVRLPDYVEPTEQEHTPTEPTEPDPLQKFFENYMLNSLDAARRSTQADALHEYYMNKGDLPRPVIEVHVDQGPQSITNLLQHLYNRPIPTPTKPNGSSATYQQGNKKPVSTKAHH
ncbi:MAG TPA: secretin N-terminal domain-containing protein [Verrucomicrobiota bacterium]|nr:secretin N-terminal domain-containing protein [Verrucomicrobiota bacterium]